MSKTRKVEEVEDLQNKVDSILRYLYKLDDFTQTASHFHFDSCMCRDFRNYYGFSQEYPVILKYMVLEGLIKRWSCHIVHHSYYALTPSSLRELNLEKILD